MSHDPSDDPRPRVYYEDQTDWTPADWHGLWRYLNRLFQFVGPTAGQLARPDSLSAQIAQRRQRRRDEELAAIDLSRTSQGTRYLMKHVLIHQGRYRFALRRFPNLKPLADVGELDHPLVLDEHPMNLHRYYVEHGILL